MDSKPKHPKAPKYGSSLAGVRSFKELEARISSLSTKTERGDAWEVWCEGFLVQIEGLDPGNLWPQKKIPLLDAERLELPAGDYGIDGVYLATDDDAYQFKFRTGRGTLDWHDLATFGFLAHRSKFRHKIVVTNCEQLVSELQKSITCIRGSRFDQLTPEQFEAIEDYLNQRPPKKKLNEPRADQHEAICAINQQSRQRLRNH
jgi:hypothetical protein